MFIYMYVKYGSLHTTEEVFDTLIYMYMKYGSLQTVEDVLYIASGHFNFNTKGGYFFRKKKPLNPYKNPGTHEILNGDMTSVPICDSKWWK